MRRAAGEHVDQCAAAAVDARCIGRPPHRGAGGADTVRVVQIQVTVAARRSATTGLQLTAVDGRSQEINSYAAPILLQETLSAQNANIDTISGATHTSDGYIQSLQSALDQAAIR